MTSLAEVYSGLANLLYKIFGAMAKDSYGQISEYFGYYTLCGAVNY